MTMPETPEEIPVRRCEAPGGRVSMSGRAALHAVELAVRGPFHLAAGTPFLAGFAPRRPPGCGG